MYIRGTRPDDLMHQHFSYPQGQQDLKKKKKLKYIAKWGNRIELKSESKGQKYQSISKPDTTSTFICWQMLFTKLFVNISPMPCGIKMFAFRQCIKCCIIVTYAWHKSSIPNSLWPMHDMRAASLIQDCHMVL